MLTTDLVFRYAKLNGLYNSKYSVSKRLKELYHDEGLIVRPERQKKVSYPEKYNLVHRVSAKGIDLLKKYDLYEEYAPRAGGFYEHQMGVATTYASYYLDAMERGMKVELQHEICNRIGRGTTINVNGAKVNPDAILVIHYAKPLLVFIEFDRATEAGESTDTKNKSWGVSIEQYGHIISSGTPTTRPYKLEYGLPVEYGAHLHVVTILRAMESKILRQVAKHFPKGCSFIGVYTANEFGDETHPPKELHMLDVEFERYNNPPFTFRRPVDIELPI